MNNTAESARSLPPITITLTRYAEPDWLVMETLESLSRQKGIHGEVLFLDQNEKSPIDLSSLDNGSLVFKREVIPARSLSYARNLAIKKAENDLILYIDSDALAEPSWARRLTEALLQENAAVVGGKIILKWHKKPLWITRSRVVHEQYSSLDLGDSLKETTKIVGASFGLNRKLLGDQAYFDEELGRRPGILLGGEETDLCKRALASKKKVFYQGSAIVFHQVLPERISYKWLLRRLYFSGYGRAFAGGLPSSTHTKNLWDYLAIPIILPVYLLGFAKGKMDKKKHDH